MRHTIPLITIALSISIPFPSPAADTPQWNAFRGTGDSTTTLTNLPTTWSDTENIAWRNTLAGYGQSSPVIWNNQVYVTSSDGDQKETLIVESFDVESGDQLWSKEFPASQKPPEVSDMISRAAPTPVADENGVATFFESGDLIALDPDGNVRWQRNLTGEYGNFKGGHGVASSLINTPDHLILLIDHDGPSYLLAIDKETGQNKWKVDRDPRISWSSPLFLVHNDVPQIIISSNGIVEAYNASDGSRLWWTDAISGNTVASPTRHDDTILVAASDPNNCAAIKLGGSGDVTDSHLLWRAQSVTSSFASPLVHKNVAYYVNRAGALQATNLSDGALLHERRLPASCWASPLAANDHLYFFSTDGQTTVFDAANPTNLTELAVNSVAVPEGDRLYGFAVAPDTLILRSGSELVAVRAPAQ
ncbi:MAG: PQQ-binding-like beta-propeller repeat protein [Verrucomicrobiota bacterium]